MEAIKKYYHIGLVCLMNRNLGNGMTNYALYQFLTDYGFSILMVDVPISSKDSCAQTWKKNFMKLPYRKDALSEQYKYKEELLELNDSCDMFLLGSDQLLRAKFIETYAYHTCMDWVYSSKYKIAYAASFGVDVFENELIYPKVKYYLNRFQRISVREKSGAELVKNQFGLEAEWVLDPVFLCERKHYEELSYAGEGRLPEGKYVSAYLLDSITIGEQVIERVSKRYRIPEHIAILESQLECENGYKGLLHTMPLAKIEEWLAMIKNSQYVITDSYHGVCFALIFQKEFCIIFNKKNWRGLARIESLLSLLNLQERMVWGENEIKHLLESSKIDYSKVNTILLKEKEKSIQWLLEAIQAKSQFEAGVRTYDLMLEKEAKYTVELRKVLEENKQNNLQIRQLRSDLFMAQIVRYRQIDRKNGKNMEVIGWGAGNCFHRNYEKIKKVYPLKYICDSNPDKWGTCLAEDVRCISPKQLEQMWDVFVIIMVDSPAIALEIANTLLSMGINYFEHIENWLNFVYRDERQVKLEDESGM